MSMADHETATDTERRLRMTGTVGFKISAGVAYTGVFIGGMFWTAGGVDWVRGWVYLGLISVGHGLSALYVRWKMPGLLGHRGRVGKGTKAWDMVLLSVFLLAFWSILIVAALDHRFGGSTMSGGLWPVGAAIFASSLIFATWAMSVNPHFEKTVRIQADRDHRVIDTGPYRIVRHPGYLGFIPALSFAPPLPARLVVGIHPCARGRRGADLAYGPGGPPAPPRAARLRGVHPEGPLPPPARPLVTTTANPRLCPRRPRRYHHATTTRERLPSRRQQGNPCDSLRS